jgi:hypothetical protein
MLIDFGSWSGSLMIVLFTVAIVAIFGSFLAILLIRIFDVDHAAEGSRYTARPDHPIRKAA